MPWTCRVPGPKPPDKPVAQILTHEGRSVVLVDLGSSASDALRGGRGARPGSTRTNPAGSSKAPGSCRRWAAASMASSSLLAGNVFLATANPATLMTIGTGVGLGRDGAGRNRRPGALRRRQHRPDAGGGAAHAVRDRLGGRDRRAPRPGAARTRPALRHRGRNAARPGGPRLRPLRVGGRACWTVCGPSFCNWGASGPTPSRRSRWPGRAPRNCGRSSGSWRKDPSRQRTTRGTRSPT